MMTLDFDSLSGNSSAEGGSGTVLSPETLFSHLAALELITAMWQGTDELEVSSRDADAVHLMGEYLNLPLQDLGSPSAQHLKDRLPSSIHLSLLIHPENGAENPATGWQRRKVKLDLEFIVRRPSDSAAKDGYDQPKATLRSPDWLRRDLFDRVCEAVKAVEAAKRTEVEEGGEGDVVGFVMDLVERISQVVLEGLELHPPMGDDGTGNGGGSTSTSFLPSATSNQQGAAAAAPTESLRVLRTWSYLPSLSSKEKRNDIVTYALSHTPPLTGFVLAGKPGLIVLEHPLASTPSSPATAKQLRDATVSLDTYWSRIKSQSWADIPSGHKKVSEKFREEDVSPAFETFEEMTEREEVGGKGVVAYGGKRNKSDLRSVQQWLDAKGLEGRMEKVLGADWGGA